MVHFMPVLKFKPSLTVNRLHQENVSIFIDKGFSLNSISHTLAESLNLKVIVDKSNIMLFDLDFGQSVHRQCSKAEMTFWIPVFLL